MSANIRTFFVPIHPRRRPGRTTVENYDMLAGKITLALGVYMERAFGYTAIIRDDTTHRTFQDNIHITIGSYFTLTQHITQHVFEHIHKPAREPPALVYNWDFLNQERAYTQGRDTNNSTPARRSTNINTNHSNRATSSSSTQTLDTCREKRGRTEEETQEEKDVEMNDNYVYVREAGTQTTLTAEGLNWQITRNGVQFS